MPKYTTKIPLSGYIYLVREEHGLFKIGRSRDLQQRMQTLNSAMPYSLELVSAVWVSNARCVELTVQEMLAKYRVKGEWYRLESPSEWSNAIQRALEKSEAIVPRRGGKNNAKFSNDEVVSIRERHRDGARIIELSREYGVHVTTIENIISYRVYKSA